MAVCLVAPVEGPVIADYSPSGQYSGHWGIDFAADRGAPVRSPVAGVVSFAGSVAGMKTVTIRPSMGFKVSLSYLDEIEVVDGAHVGIGQRIATAGLERGVGGVHLSVRFNGKYVDPAPYFRCRSNDISRALRLLRPPQPYPRRRAHGNPRRNLRSDPHSSSPRRRGRASSGRVGSRALHASRGPVAEVGSSGVGR